MQNIFIEKVMRRIRYMILGFVFTAIMGCSTKTEQEIHLEQSNWDYDVYNAIIQLIRANGVLSDTYNEYEKPYAVFDFDNTTAINDVQEALLIYQIENLRFAFSSREVEAILETGIPDVLQNFQKEYCNKEGKPLNVSIVVDDIAEAYDYLYTNYEGFGRGGTQSLEMIKKTPQYAAFSSKLRFLYDAINATFDASVGYPWVTYLFTGMSPAEVQKLAQESNDYWLAYGRFSKLYWKTPKEFAGKSGIVEVAYKTGLAFPKEMQNLYECLQTYGIDVYVCSASFIDVIIASANTERYGYKVPKENIFAMRLKLNDKGKYINEFDENYFQTQGQGKVKTIDKFIRSQYNNRQPILIAGDSEGDYQMLQYPKLKLGIIINRYKQELLDLVTRKDTKTIYVLQGRDENKGQFRSSRESILLGNLEEGK